MQTIQQRCEESARNFMQLANLAPTINSAATAIITAIGNGGKVMFCGNGGSAADSQHLAAELMGRFCAIERLWRPWP